MVIAPSDKLAKVISSISAVVAVKLEIVIAAIVPPSTLSPDI